MQPVATADFRAALEIATCAERKYEDAISQPLANNHYSNLLSSPAKFLDFGWNIKLNKNRII